MLRGLDRATSGEDDPVMVKVHDRVDLCGEMTVYMRDSPPSYVHDRQRAVLGVVDALESSGVVEEVPVVRWPKQIREPADEHGKAAIETYEDFLECVGRTSLEPFFEEKPATGRHDRVVVFPVISIAFRSDGELTGLYPRWEDGTHHSIEDCLNALTAGDAVANVSE